METWIIKSNQVLQRLSSVALIIVGSVLMFAFRNHAGTFQFTDGAAGFFLGVIVFSVGFISIIYNYTETVIVDPNTKKITVQSSTVLGSKEHSTSFDQIVNVRVGFFGRASNLIFQSFYVVLELKDGTSTHLFFPGYYEGRGNRSVAEMRCKKIEEYLKP